MVSVNLTKLPDAALGFSPSLDFTNISLAYTLSYSIPSSISPTCPYLDGCRTLYSIISSCLATLWLCNWVAIHFDVPDPQGGWLSLFIRCLCFLLGVIVPEVWIYKAIVQCLDARQIRKIVAKSDAPIQWTIRHSYFVLMGGLAERTRDGTLSRVDPPKWMVQPSMMDSKGEDGNSMDDLLPKIQAYSITDEDIKALSKQNILSKAIAVLQTIWFAIQIASRRVQDLPIIPLEAFTLSFACFAVVQYAANWYKPYGVDRPFVIGTLEDENCAKTWPVCELKAESVMLVDDEDDDSTGAASFAALVLAVPAGAVHFLAWNSNFPTTAARNLWRIFTVISTASPLFSFVLGIPYMVLSEWEALETLRAHVPAWICSVLEGMAGLLTLAVVIAYAVSRLGLLVLVVLALFNMPDGAYKTVAWTNFIPHL